MVPVAVFAFNRPLHLCKCLESLSAAVGAESTSVTVYADGPRGPADLAPVGQVRALLEEHRWPNRFSEFKVISALSNQGLARSIVSGVDRMLAQHEAVIVLEDDLVVAPGFLAFMNDCLEFYKSDGTVGSVTGYCPLPEAIRYGTDVMAVPRICSHGWGTWRDRWKSVDWQAGNALRIWAEPSLRKRMNCAGSDQLYRLRRQIGGRIRTWAIIFQLWLVLNDKVTVYPTRNLVKNIGFDGSGTHTLPGDVMYSRIESRARTFRMQAVQPRPEIVDAFRRIYSGSLLGRIKRWFINLRPPAAPAP